MVMLIQMMIGCMIVLKERRGKAPICHYLIIKHFERVFLIATDDKSWSLNMKPRW